jgi:alkylation response protein AidB-like acyl-CoA dehydrogenase
MIVPDGGGPDVDTTENLAAFEQRLAAWLRTNIAGRNESDLASEDRRGLTRSMYDAGFLAVTWPTHLGGRDLSADHQTVVNRLTAECSWIVPSPVTVGICAPTLLEFGTEEQQQRHIPRMLDGSEAWTQLLSEPGAGSDLASVATQAERRGDDWIVTGQKVWTSDARESDLALALVRTDSGVSGHTGLSMLIMDLRAEGVDIRPLKDMTGASMFNEVFIDAVKVPADAIVGTLNHGWEVLRGMLVHERMALGAGTTGGRMSRSSFESLVRIAAARGVSHRPEVRSSLSMTYIEERLLDATGERLRLSESAGQPAGPLGSLGKLGLAKSARASAEAGVVVGGAAATAWLPEDSDAEMLAHDLLYFPMTGIAGGTTEIQRNIVAEHVLGLPREPRPERGRS